MTNNEFLDANEIEIQQEGNRTWSAYRFGTLIVRNAPSKKALMEWLRKKYRNKE